MQMACKYTKRCADSLSEVNANEKDNNIAYFTYLKADTILLN